MESVIIFTTRKINYDDVTLAAIPCWTKQIYLRLNGRYSRDKRIKIFCLPLLSIQANSNLLLSEWLEQAAVKERQKNNKVKNENQPVSLSD